MIYLIETIRKASCDLSETSLEITLNNGNYSITSTSKDVVIEHRLSKNDISVVAQVLTNWSQRK